MYYCDIVLILESHVNICCKVLREASTLIYVKSLRKKCRTSILNLLYWGCARAALNVCVKKMLNNCILPHCPYTVIIGLVFNILLRLSVFSQKQNVWALNIISSISISWKQWLSKASCKKMNLPRKLWLFTWSKD